jgi:alkanesulfonate monooxygenase SsuD/methylene tetrahydromethanopterin reductase-like flavin-dependent oxidoreductase (luciferase family)
MLWNVKGTLFASICPPFGPEELQMASVHFGLFLPAESHDVRRRATYVAEVNRFLVVATGHFDSAWIVDHLQFGDTDVLEGFTTLAYMASLHPQLRFGHAVLCQSFRNPALLAKMGATLQLLSGGRFILGLGAGWNEEEYRAYGYDFPPAAVRVGQLEEALQIITALWTQEQVTFDGTYYRVIGAICQPRPQPTPPISLGASRPRMLRLAATYADEWDVSSTHIERYEVLAGAFERACVEVGRDPSMVGRSWSGGCACAPTQREAEVLAGDSFGTDPTAEDFGFVGTPEQIVEQMRPFIALGVRRFKLDCVDFPRVRGLDLLINEVLPVLNG